MAMVDTFSVDDFQQKLKASTIGRKLIYSDVTGSTMDDARKYGVNVEEYPHGTVVMAERQTKARGARNHKWDASNTGNIYVSIILHLPQHYVKTLKGIFEIEVAACMAVFGPVREMGIQVVTKWPNDLWVKGHKLAGFLLEDGHYNIPDTNLSLVILGIGINVNADIRENKNICNIATSLMCERNGAYVKREDFFADVCFALEENLFSESENWLKYQHHNLFQKNCKILITMQSENLVVDGEFLEILENYDIRFIDKRTGETVEGGYKHFSIRPKVHRKILVVSSDLGMDKPVSLIASRLTSIVDTSKYIVCSLPETAITHSDEWMKTCELLVLPEDVRDSMHLTSKLTSYLTMGGNLLTLGLASYFTAKIFGIPFKEAVLEPLGHNLDVSVISVEGQQTDTEDGGHGKSSGSKITCLSSSVYFKFSKDFALKDLISEMPDYVPAENRETDLLQTSWTKQSEERHVALKYVPCRQKDQYCIAILTRPTTYGGSLGLVGFDIGVTLPSPLPSSEDVDKGDTTTSVEKLLGDVDRDRFRRDELIRRVLRVFNIV